MLCVITYSLNPNIVRYNAQGFMPKLSPLSVNVGKNIRQIRSDNSLSLSQTSDLTGVSKAMLGQIERFESSPTVELLWKLAQGLGVPFTQLIGEQSQPITGDAVQRKDGMSVKVVFHASPNNNLDMFDIHLYRDVEIKRPPHQTGVKEYIWVLSGTLDVYFDGTWHTVRENSSLIFNADQAHGYRAVDGPTRFSNTITY